RRPRLSNREPRGRPPRHPQRLGPLPPIALGVRLPDHPHRGRRAPPGPVAASVLRRTGPGSGPQGPDPGDGRVMGAVARPETDTSAPALVPTSAAVVRQ